MQYQLFAQSHSEHKFIASVVGMLMVSGEGVTENEAIAHAKVLLKSQLATGKFGNIEVGSEVDSVNAASELDFSMQYAGIFADDPTFDDWIVKLTSIRKGANMVIDS